MKVYDLNNLPRLIEGKEYLLITDLPEVFRLDLKTFMIGETLMPNEKGELRISKMLYKAWLEKLFDYDINLRFVNE